MSDIGALTILLPPTKEQNYIVSSVRKQTSGLDLAMSRIEREIELLREYRTRLIADVVTGQLDVREAAAHLPAEASDEALKTTDADLDADEDVPDEEAIAE